MASARALPARIDDYANPRFSPDIEAMREAVVPMAAELRLELAPLIAQAATETGLTSFGDHGFRERLDVWLRALREEADLAPFGVVGMYHMILQLLRNRLLIEDLLERHPEIRDIPIERPIVIAGLPRTGTTHLHNLISADPALRSLPYWESLEPVQPWDEHADPEAPDPRWARTRVAVDVINTAMPYFKRMHEMTVDHVHEEIQLLAIDFSSMLMETSALVPSWRDYFRAHDQAPHYEYLKTVLQVLTFLRGGTRWVLKSPQHCEQLRVIAKVFPDATFVMTHRDPVRVTASVITMVTYAARMNAAHPDPRRYGAYWSERVEDLLLGCLRDRDALPPDRIIDVRFDEYMQDDIGMVRRIYDVARQPFTEESHAAMSKFMADHPRGRHGTVVYTLGDFGIDDHERRAALRPYAERFSLAEER